jgi:hypothetical protein
MESFSICSNDFNTLDTVRTLSFFLSHRLKALSPVKISYFTAYILKDPKTLMSALYHV